MTGDGLAVLFGIAALAVLVVFRIRRYRRIRAGQEQLLAELEIMRKELEGETDER